MIKASYLEQQDARLASQLVADKSLDADKQQRIEKPFIHSSTTNNENDLVAVGGLE